jgi:hypothetical protein
MKNVAERRRKSLKSLNALGARLVRDDGAAGSNPVTPTNLFNDLASQTLNRATDWATDWGRCRSVAQPGSAPVSGSGGRRFKSCRSDHSPALAASEAAHG